MCLPYAITRHVASLLSTWCVVQTVRQALHVKATIALEAILRAKGTLRMQLPALDELSTGELISGAFEGADVAPELTHEIHGKTGGLPLYVEQVPQSTPDMLARLAVQQMEHGTI